MLGIVKAEAYVEERGLVLEAVVVWGPELAERQIQMSSPFQRTQLEQTCLAFVRRHASPEAKL